jgi:hypothetical protein
MKFHETKFRTINHWYHLLDDLTDDLFNVYIWVESKKKPDGFIKKYHLQRYSKKQHINFITHFNKKDFCNDIEVKQKNVDQFMKDNGITNFIPHCHAHFKSFFLTKEEYIINLDADDMFYDFLSQEHLLKCIDFLLTHEVPIITRPFWFWRGAGWSFGFTVSKKNVLDYLHIFKFRGKKWFEKNMKERFPCYNLDHYFGAILIGEKKIPIENLFFGFKDHFWSTEKALRGEIDFLERKIDQKKFPSNEFVIENSATSDFILI